MATITPTSISGMPGKVGPLAINQSLASTQPLNNMGATSMSGMPGKVGPLAINQSSINTPAPVITKPQTSTTTITNANKINAVPGIVSKTDQLANKGITSTTNPDGSVVSTYADGKAVPGTMPGDIGPDGKIIGAATDIYDRNTGQLIKPNVVVKNTPVVKTNSVNTTTSSAVSQGGYVGDVYYPPGASLPNGPDGKPSTTTETSPADDNINRNLQDLRSATDALTAANIASIQASFKQLREQQQQSNTAQEKQVNNALLMGGVTGQGSSAQYAPISSTGIMSAQINYGIQQIADLNAKENAAIILAQQAGLDGDYKIMGKINEQIEKTRKEKVDATVALNEKIQAQTSKLAEQNIQASRDSTISDLYSQGVTDTGTMLKALNYDEAGNQIGDFTAEEVSKTLKSMVPPGLDDLVKTLRDNGAPGSVIQAVLASGNLGAAYQAAGDYVKKVEKPTGKIAEYQFAQTNDGYKGTYDQWLNMDANRKEKVVAASSNPNRQLTLAELQAYNLPAGSTAADALGKKASKPATEAQQLDAGYAQRLVDSGQVIKGLESDIAKMSGLNFWSAKLGENTAIGNAFVPDNIKQIRQAERDFATAKLRKESGASISPTEFETFEKQYFPRPGDDEKTLAQKTKLRQSVTDSMIRSSASAYGANASVPSVAQSEADAEQAVIDYGNQNPNVQADILRMTTEDDPDLGRPMTYEEVLQVYNQ